MTSNVRDSTEYTPLKENADDTSSIPLLDVTDSLVDLDIGTGHHAERTANVWQEVDESETLLDALPGLNPWKDEGQSAIFGTQHIADSEHAAPSGVVASAVDFNEGSGHCESSLEEDPSHVKGFYNGAELKEIMDLQVSGQLPSWLVCEFFTVGPGTYDIKYMRKVEIDGQLQNVSRNFTFGHWFDSLPLVNRFDIQGQRNSISYRNRLTSQSLIEKIRDNQGYSPTHPAGLFKTKTNQTVLAKFLGVGNPQRADYEPCGAHVLPRIPGLEGRLFCQNYASHIQEVDPFDMHSVRLLTWSEINPAFKGYTSCPNGHIDPTTNEYINFTMDIGYRSTRYNFFSISERNPRGTLIATVTAPPSYVNSFALTHNYIVLVIFPLVAKAGGVKFSWNDSVLDSFAFSPTQPTLFYVISRESRAHVATYRSDPCFAFHHANAFEDAHGNVYLDILCYPDDTIAHQLTTENLRHPARMLPSRLEASELRRYVLHNVNFTRSLQRDASVAATRTKSSGFLNALIRKSSASSSTNYMMLPEATFNKWLEEDCPIELPQMNPNVRTQHYTFLYGLGFSSEKSKFWDTIVKTNVVTRSVVATWHEDGCYPSEAVFIPRPVQQQQQQQQQKGEEQEDDGVLLSIVLDSARDTSFLLVLDAKCLTVLARAYLGTLVPLSFARGSYRLYSSN